MPKYNQFEPCPPCPAPETATIIAKKRVASVLRRLRQERNLTFVHSELLEAAMESRLVRANVLYCPYDDPTKVGCDGPTACELPSALTRDYDLVDESFRQD